MLGGEVFEELKRHVAAYAASQGVGAELSLHMPSSRWGSPRLILRVFRPATPQRPREDLSGSTYSANARDLKARLEADIRRVAGRELNG